jgi:hypothetical protein
LAPSSSGLGHHPLKVAARVRIPLGLLRVELINLKILLHNVTFVQRFVTFSLGGRRLHTEKEKY